ncbi:hypothetical protein [Micromonospora siamensis]|uniref:hypothetical protein n=1 Tax=Micromonospora siamensis TaxID=299152 RepID=UPI000B5AEA45|nr:hypothetical protein [Micromonospora siamensis]
MGNLTPGTTYSLSAWTLDTSGRYSPRVTTRAVGTRTTISSNVTTLYYGQSFVLTGRLTRVDSGAGVPGALVELQARRLGTTSFQVVATGRSSSTGGLSANFIPQWGTEYKWVYRGSSGGGQNSSGDSLIGQASPLRTISVTSLVSTYLPVDKITLGQSAVLSGTVAPNHAGQAVYLQRLDNGAWKDVAGTKLSSTSAYSFTLKPSAKGTYYYRVRKPGDVDHLVSYSNRRTLTVS